MPHSVHPRWRASAAVLLAMAAALLLIAALRARPDPRPSARKVAARSAPTVAVAVVIRPRAPPPPSMVPPKAAVPVPPPVTGGAPVRRTPSETVIPKPTQKPQILTPSPTPARPSPEPTKPQTAASEAFTRQGPTAVTPKPSPAPPAPSLPRVEYPGERREVGRELMGVDGKREGWVPLISMDYRRRLGWPEYARLVRRLGGRFCLLDGRTEKILALVDADRLEILPAEVDALRGLSPRVRQIHSEIAIEDLLRRAAGRFPSSEPSLVLFLPLNVDFEIVGGVAQGLAERGIDVKSVARVSGEYENGPRGPRLRVTDLLHRDGRAERLEMLIDL